MTLPNKKIGDVLLKVDNISLSFGGVRAIRDVTFEIREHEILAIIGPNGAGKTSMLNVINGFYHPQVGTITYRGVTRSNTRPYDVASQGVARTFQNVALFKGMSVLDNIMTGRLLKMRGNVLLDALYWGPARRQEMEHRAFVERIIDFLEIQAIRRVPAGRLPYGLQKRVELARALAAEPELLLLDEPMAGMNVEEKEDMCRFILDVNEEFGTTIALIEHDMGVVMDICDRIVVLDYGRKIADGPPDAIRNDQAVIDAYLGLSHDEPAEQSGVAARTPAAAGAGGGS
ncbi:MAG TPA: ABC transporter ATP-binding protein [Alphaproteobacteria bacterium]